MNPCEHDRKVAHVDRVLVLEVEVQQPLGNHAVREGGPGPVLLAAAREGAGVGVGWAIGGGAATIRGASGVRETL